MADQFRFVIKVLEKGNLIADHYGPNLGAVKKIYNQSYKGHYDKGKDFQITDTKTNTEWYLMKDGWTEM